MTRILPAHERVLRRIEVGDDGCWLWAGSTTWGGYGHVRRTSRREDGMVYVHRAVYEALVGPIPDRVDVEHVCHTWALRAGRCEGGTACVHRRCVNPLHLEAISRRDNLLRGNTGPAANAAKTHCRHGHPYSGPNLIQNKNGTRACRTCKNGQRRRKGQPTIWPGDSDSVLRQSVHAEGA